MSMTRNPSALPAVRYQPAKLPPATPIDASSMPQQKRERHRQMISHSVEVVMHGYWRDNLPDAMRAAVLADWADELEEWPIDSIRAALRKHRRENPNKRPNPGHILSILRESWGRRNAEAVRQATASHAPEAKTDRITAEKAEAIMKELGVKLGRIDP